MFAGVLILNVLFAVAGLAILFGARGWGTWRGVLGDLGLAYVLGLGAVVVVATLSLLVGLGASTPTVVLIAAVLAGIGGAVGAVRHRPFPHGFGSEFRGPRTLEELLTAAAAALVLVVAAALYLAFRNQPLIAYDAWNFWIPKAKVIYFFNGLDQEVFKAIKAPSYPIFVPTLDAIVFHFTHSTDATALAQQNWFVLVGFLGAAVSVLAPLTRRSFVWLFLALFLILPQVDLRWFQLLADWTLDWFFVLAALLIARWLRTREAWLLTILPIPLAALLITKREGQLFALCLAIGTFAATAREWRRAWPRFAAILIGSYAVSQLPWRLWWTSRHFPSDLNEGGTGHTGSLHRVFASAHVVAQLLFSNGMWYVVVPLALVAAAAALIARRGGNETTLYLVTAGVCFIGLTWVMWSDPAIPLDTNPALNPTPREVASIVLLSLLFTPVLVSNALGSVAVPAFGMTPDAAWRRLVPAAHAWIVSLRPSRVVAAFVAAEWLAVVLAVARIRHSGWIFYQGGDQLWYYTNAWLFAHGSFSVAGVGYLWSFLLAPVALVAGPNAVSGFPAVVLFDVVVLLPVAMLCVYGIAVRLAGRVFGYWTLAVWLLLPFVGVLYTDAGYHQKYTELTIPQGLGLTAMADFPTMVATAICAYFCVRLLVDAEPRVLDGVAAGVAAGAAIALKPSAALFLAAPAIAFAAARLIRPLAAFAVGLTPALLTMLVWKLRGLGNVPVIGHAASADAAGVGRPGAVLGNTLPAYFHLDWSHFLNNLDLIREHFWSVRLVEWVVIAGTIAVFRLSRRIGLFLAVWFFSYAIAKGAYPNASIEDSSLLRLLIPIVPAFVLLVAALPFLLPRLTRKVVAVRTAHWHARPIWLGVAVLVTAVAPLAAIAAGSPDRGPSPRAVFLAEPPIPLGVDLGVAATASAAKVSLTWRAQHSLGGPLFYHVFRAPQSSELPACSSSGATDQCYMSTYSDLGTAQAAAFADKPGPGRWTYRIGVAANWLDDPQYGDVYLLSRPVSVTVH